MPRYLILFLLLGLPPGLVAQPLTLDACYEQAEARSPLQQQRALQASITGLRDAQLAARWLPQFQLSGQLTYQSDVITFPELPIGGGFPELPQTQYNVFGELNQPIYEGGAIKQGRALNAAQHQVTQQQLAVELYQLREQIDRLYFGILTLEQQDRVLASTLAELAARQQVVAAGVEHGVVLPGELDAFRLRVLELEQRRREIEAERLALRKMLATWTGQENLPDSLLQPAVQAPAPTLDWQRPEYALFEAQQQQLGLAQEATRSETLPKLSAFARGGVGSPNPLNFIETGTEGYYLLGLRLQWQPWQWRRQQREREILHAQQQLVDTRRESLDQRLNVANARDQEQLQALTQLIAKDEEMLALQDKIVQQAASQLENGIITATDYLAEVEAQTQRRLQLEVHRLQRLQAQVNLRTRTGMGRE